MKLRTEGSTLNGFLDKGSHFQGGLDFEETFRIDGKFEGKIRSGRELVLGDTAEVVADVAVERLSVNGTLRGSIRATGRVELLAHARVFGEISTPLLRIEEGAHFEGSCRMQLEAASNLLELPFPVRQA